MSSSSDETSIEAFKGVDAYTIADAARRVGTGGVIHKLRPQTAVTTFVGRALTARVQYEPHRDILLKDYGAGPLFDRAAPNDVLILDGGGTPLTALGDLASIILKRRGAVGAVVNAYVRDIESMEKEFPVFAIETAITTIAGHGFITGIGEAVHIDGISIATGDLVAGCRGGIAAVPWAMAGKVLKEALRIVETDRLVQEGIRRGETVSDLWQRHKNLLGLRLRMPEEPVLFKKPGPRQTRAISGIGNQMFFHLPGQQSVPQRLLLKMVAASLGMGLICCPQVMAQDSNAQIPPQIKALAAKAQAEREVVIYTAQSDDINGELKSGFEKAFGVKMSYARLVAGPQIEKIRQELGANSVRVDVFDIGDRNFVREMADSKLLQPISDLGLTVGAPADASVSSYCVQAQQFSHAIAFNTRLVPDNVAPHTWTDLLAPSLKGQIGVLSPRVGGGILAWWYVMTTELGEDFFTKLAPQNVRMYEDVGSIDNDLASGAIAVQIPAWPYAIQGLVDAGAPIKAVYPSPTSGVASSDCLMKAAPHPNAGKLFIWYVMTKEGQTALNGHHRGYSVIPGVEDSAPAPAKTVFPPSADIAAARDKLFALADKTARPGK